MTRWLPLLLLLAAAPGCRFSGVPLPAPIGVVLAKEGLSAPKDERPVLPYRLAVLPLRISFKPTALFKDDPTKHASHPDPEVFRDEIVEAFRASGLFARVEDRGGATETRERAQELAWSANDDLVLELEFSSYHQEYLGHTNYLWWLLVYSTYVWPAWMVPVDEYGGGLRVVARLRSVQEGAKPLWESEYEVRAEETKQEFTPSDRETVGFFDLSALWNVETSLEEANWRAIERGVGPHTRQKFLVKLLRDLRDRVVVPLREQRGRAYRRLSRRLRKRYALVVGVSRYADPAVGTAPHAAADARRLASFWSSPRGGGLVEGRDIHVLIDEQATRAGILKAVAALAKRVNVDDEVLIYFSGYGTSLTSRKRRPKRTGASGGLGGLSGVGAGPAAWRPLFLGYDARRKNLRRSALSLLDLGKALDAIPAQRVALLFDVSFSGRKGRSRTIERRRRPRVATADLAHGLLAARGRCALFAGRAHHGANVLGDAKAGLFTSVILRGLSGAADSDSDTLVTLKELYRYVRVEVSSRAGLEGYSQRPLGLQLNNVTLVWPR